MAEKKIETENIEQTEQEKAIAQEEYLNEKVPFKAFKDNKEYKYDLIVGINGKNYVIKRGVEVMIPRKVKLIIESSDRAAKEQADKLEELSKTYAV